MSFTEPTLTQLFIDIQNVIFQSQSMPFFSCITCLNKQIRKEDADPTNNTSFNQEQNNLQMISKINFKPSLIAKLNKLWDGTYYGRSLKSLFSRNYQRQRRSFKQLQKNIKRQAFCELKRQINWQKIELRNEKNSVLIQFNGQDLQSIKKGQITSSIVINYIKILNISKIINASYYIFPFGFINKIVGNNNLESNQEQLKATYQQFKDQIKVNIASLQYLFIPVFIQNRYKLIIVKGVSNLGTRRKSKIILCNITRDKCDKYIEAIRTLLQFELNISTKRSKRIIVKESTLPAISLLLPRQFSPNDVGLYIMLYCQFLFARQGVQLENLTEVQSWKKLHLFPRSIAEQSRPQIWNLFVKFIEEPNEDIRGRYGVDFFKKRLRICDEASLELNYDKIQEQENEKYLILSNAGEKVDRFEHGLKYYLDTDINYQKSFQK